MSSRIRERPCPLQFVSAAVNSELQRQPETQRRKLVHSHWRARPVSLQSVYHSPSIRIIFDSRSIRQSGSGATMSISIHSQQRLLCQLKWRREDSIPNEKLSSIRFRLSLITTRRGMGISYYDGEQGFTYSAFQRPPRIVTIKEYSEADIHRSGLD